MDEELRRDGRRKRDGRPKTEDGRRKKEGQSTKQEGWKVKGMFCA